MLYLVTGSNGTGKTLNTLKWVRDLQLQNLERPVFHNGRFKFKPEKESEFGWSKFDFKDWQSLPDGAICLVDEAHNDLPVRPAGQKPPDYIGALAEHRSRGFDFFFITQHPSNLDGFVRRLIGAPGWHRHLKRPFGHDKVSCLQFDAPNLQCEKPGAGKAGTMTRIPFPKEVYGWYDSAVMHTGKKHIPRQVWMVLGGIVLVPLLVYLAGSKLLSRGDKHEAPEPAGPVPAVLTAGGGNAAQGLKMSKEQWLVSFEPRLPGLPFTAPRYDDITKPVRAPVPAACIHMPSKGCTCYTQHGTLLPSVPDDLCMQIVNNGYFLDFDPEPRRDDGRREVVSGRQSDPEGPTPYQPTPGDIANASHALTGENGWARNAR